MHVHINFYKKKIKVVIRKKMSDFLLWNKRYCVFLFVSVPIIFLFKSRIFGNGQSKKVRSFFPKRIIDKNHEMCID